MVGPELLPFACDALHSVVHTHQAPAALTMLTVLVRPLLYPYPVMPSYYVADSLTDLTFTQLA